MKINTVKIIVALLFCLLLISPIKSAHSIALNEVPSYNDAWDDSLTKIKADASDGIGYITTWWDFGHWFVAKGIRVTFDGGDQGKRIHWVGKSFLTSDENTSVGILRMLNCGQIKPSLLLEKEFGNDTVKAINVINDIILVDKQTASEKLSSEGLSQEVIDETLDLTHCDDLMDHYVITSEDMVGKAGVWGHFGAWNFTKAKIWQSVRGTKFDKGVTLLTSNFSIPAEDAPGIYYEIQSTDADRWISPWPGYLSGKSSCSEDEGVLLCQNGVKINLTDMSATASTQQGLININSVSYVDGDGEFKIVKSKGNTAPYSVLLLPDNSALLVDPLHAGSMFTRLFYYNGVGLDHFELFNDVRQITGGRIQVWKVNFSGEEPVEETINETETILDIEGEQGNTTIEGVE